jgi:hypothetical protein
MEKTLDKFLISGAKRKRDDSKDDTDKKSTNKKAKVKIQ